MPGKACGAFRHNRKLVHTDRPGGGLVQFRVTAQKRRCPQPCTDAKCLAAKGKKALVHSAAAPLATTTNVEIELPLGQPGRSRRRHRAGRRWQNPLPGSNGSLARARPTKIPSPSVASPCRRFPPAFPCTFCRFAQRAGPRTSAFSASRLAQTTAQIFFSRTSLWTVPAQPRACPHEPAPGWSCPVLENAWKARLPTAVYRTQVAGGKRQKAGCPQAHAALSYYDYV